MTRLAPLAVLALVASAPALAQPAPAASDRLSCTSPFGPKTSHAEIVAALGKENVAWQKVYAAEGEEMGATVIYPKIENRRIEIFWSDEKKRTGLVNVRLTENSLWVAPNGVRSGMSLAEVETLNGRPFTLSGFFWDYGGYVSDWKGGALDGPSPGGCTVNVRFTVAEDASDAVTSKVSGDKEFSSADKRMRAAKPFVGTLGYGFPQR